MNLLLDTQTFIWIIQNDSRLGPKTKELVRAPQNQVVMSFVSFFEMVIKASLRKLYFDPSILNDLEKMGITFLAGDSESLRSYTIFNEANKDPFDNFLLATAKAHKLTLLSSDNKILSLRVKSIKTLDSRE